jgi:M6 family metalloprotease-like protein
MRGAPRSAHVRAVAVVASAFVVLIAASACAPPAAGPSRAPAQRGAHARSQPASSGVGAPVSVVGPQRLLVVPVRFPDVAPQRSMQQITGKVRRVVEWVREASYGKASIEPTVLDWQPLPRPLGTYRVSQYNFQVDRDRVRRLVEDTLAAASRTARVGDFPFVYIVVGAHTEPGKGYGMIAYAANPGMLTGVRSGRVDVEPIALPGGGTYAGGVIVSAENAHPGHVVHDLLHALGGAKDGKRPVPDLYDYELQSNPPKGERMTPELFSIHTGPWDIMSHHFIRMDETPPPPPSSFIRRQLGWIDDAQVVTVRPGETREVTLAPLESGGSPLVVRIPLGPARYLLVENRQPTGLGAVLPSSGMLVLEVNEDREEGTDIVRAIDANPGVPKLARAPFQPGSGERRAHVSAADGVAVAPLAIERGGRLRLVVTTPDRAPAAGPSGPRR